ncbi:MAG: DNA replication/repair protein RecF [Gammaproteobacteria bacterium]
MQIQHLEVANVRNLLSLQIDPHPSVNFIIGANGSGKTSLLEAISMLSRGRSFRTVQVKKVISHGAPALTVFGSVLNGSGGVDRLGVRRGADGEMLAKINGSRCERLSDLAALLPAVEVEAASFEMLEGGPSVRRELLDWGLFHVEHAFLEVWKRFKSALEQKSALLRVGDSKSLRSSLSHWNQQLAVAGQALHVSRLHYVEMLSEAFSDVARRYFGLEGVTLHYRPGWPDAANVDLASCLPQQAQTEIEQGRPLYGPQKADLAVLWNGQLARDICSRGQKKLVIYGVRLAQVVLLHRLRHVAPVLLLDDLPAELDYTNIEKISMFLRDYPCQSFITAIDKDLGNGGLLHSFGDHRMFHVEHGQLTLSP